MTHNASKPNAAPAPARSSPVLRRISLALASGTCVFALAIPLTGQDAWAYDLQITRQSYSGGSTWTLRKINPGFGGIRQLKSGSAPPNDCPVPAFEVVNPRRGEFRCVGYVAPW